MRTKELKRRRLVHVGLALLLTLATIVEVSARAFAQHDRIRIALVGEPTSLNPLFLSGYWYTLVSEVAFEPLLRTGLNNKFVPALATMEPTLQNGGISADGRHITIHLRQTRWSDGFPLTSADIQFAIAEALNPKNNIPSRSGVDQVQAMHLIDKNTIVFDLNRPDPSALATIESTTPLPKHLLSKYSDLNHIPYNALPVGNGPYNVVKWMRGDAIRFEANPNYWRGRPKIPILDVRIVPSATTALLELRTNEIDLLLVQPSDIAQLPATGITRNVASSLSWTQLSFNFANTAFSDKRVRQAIVLAIDREKIASATGHGFYKTARTMLPIFQWALDSGIQMPRFDAATAARLLNESGWKIAPDGLRHKGNQTLTFSMVYPTGGNSVLPSMIANNLERVHVHIDQKPIQPSLLFDTAAGGGILANGRFDLALITLQTNPDPDVSWLFRCDQRAPAGFNFWRYCNATVDAGLTLQASTFDRVRRASALRAVQRQLVTDAAFDPLFRINSLWVSAAWLHGITPSVYGPFWNIYGWTAAEP